MEALLIFHIDSLFLDYLTEGGEVSGDRICLRFYKNSNSGTKVEPICAVCKNTYPHFGLSRKS